MPKTLPILKDQSIFLSASGKSQKSETPLPHNRSLSHSVISANRLYHDPTLKWNMPYHRELKRSNLPVRMDIATSPAAPTQQLAEIVFDCDIHEHADLSYHPELDPGSSTPPSGFPIGVGNDTIMVYSVTHTPLTVSHSSDDIIWHNLKSRNPEKQSYYTNPANSDY